MARVLDLHCGAGGCSWGFHLAGFEVEGCDIVHQPKYPFKFHHMDWKECLLKFSHLFDLIVSSPPCQLYSKATAPFRNKKNYPDQIAEVREYLIGSGKPYIIENVPRAPLINPIFLNGSYFNILIHRPRLFECSFPVWQPVIPKTKRPVKMGRAVKEGDILQPVGNFIGVEYCRQQTGLHWMGQKELSQAIPPVYTKWLGEQFLRWSQHQKLVQLYHSL